MNQIDSTYSYDYNCGFSQFPDGWKFKYNQEGEICFSTDCSTWSKILLNNMKIDDYIYSSQFVPEKILYFPNFGNTKKYKKSRRDTETINNYIDTCDFCNCELIGGEFSPVFFYDKIEESFACRACFEKQRDNNEFDDVCLSCGSPDTGYGICYYCRMIDCRL